MRKYEVVSGANKNISEVILKFRESSEPLTFEESLMLIYEVEFDLIIENNLPHKLSTEYKKE